MLPIHESLNPIDIGKSENSVDCYRALWAAMMYQMLEDLKSESTRTWYSSGKTTKRDYVAARFWFKSDLTYEPGSFLAVCDTLGLDPAAVRKELCKK